MRNETFTTLRNSSGKKFMSCSFKLEVKVLTSHILQFIYIIYLLPQKDIYLLPSWTLSFEDTMIYYTNIIHHAHIKTHLGRFTTLTALGAWYLKQASD